jgi:hypothetical protein
VQLVSIWEPTPLCKAMEGLLSGNEGALGEIASVLANQGEDPSEWSLVGAVGGNLHVVGGGSASMGAYVRLDGPMAV